jgi:DNA-binding IclR family transcriptional regulator
MYGMSEMLDNHARGRAAAAARTRSAPAVDRALSILEMLATTGHGLTLPDLARRLDLPKSSVHCLLLTLERRGYLIRNECTGRYLFGLRLFGLAKLALCRIGLRERAAPFLRELMRRTHLTVHMAILEQDEAVVVEKFEPPGMLQLASFVGKRMELHCSGVGKALLAYLSEDELARLARQRGFVRYNENTITSVTRLRQEAARIRRVGYSFEDEEGEIGFRCIGCPIFDHSGAVTAAISLAGTTGQINAHNLDWLINEIRQTALAISRTLGYISDTSDQQAQIPSNKSDGSADSARPHR